MGVSMLARVAVALGLVVASANAACTKTYSVVSGDSCTTIPQKNSISSYQLTKLNPTLNCAALSIGQSLCVIDSTYNCQPVYTVKSGDTCSNIPTTNGIDTMQLINNNPQLGTACAIQVGQNLCVAKPTTTTSSTTKTTSSAAPTSTFTCTKTYTVKSGDNCQTIASSNSISFYQLTYLNPSMNCNLLSIGQSLCLTASQYNCQPVYTVKSGDTCSAIATANKITVDQIIANNPNVGSTCAISVGLSLCVKAGATSTSSTVASPTSTACTRLTIIQSGDTCDTIGARAGISGYWLGVLNPTINSACSNIQSGQALCVDSAVHNCGSVYQITGQGGCQGIANSLKMTVANMVSLNPNINSGCTNIYVNEVICTAPRPTTAPSKACTRNYSVVPGDTCNSIATKNSLTNLLLASINPSLNCNTLGVGNALCSFSPSLSICPKLVQVVANDTCFGLAMTVQMLLDEWKSINTGINCDALQIASLVCSAQGNATLPQAPSGTNPTARHGSETLDVYGRVIEILPDWTIGSLLDDLAEQKGNNITVIFYCCHSASGTRASEDPQARLVNPKDLPPLSPDTDQSIIHKPYTSSRASVVLTGFAHRGLRSHILLAACMASEVAWEREGRGAFTSAILSILRTRV
ncbi:hypothetical protein FS749_009633 [Ceratobasidium sp. UAMH 11750]|nr:hypothetical protein FS749_009633 [Ceratobasidium sp. UAMH 11750]